jgi:hypothetical protein
MLDDDLARGPSFAEQAREPQSVVLRALSAARAPDDYRWPTKLLEVVDWGGCIVSCVDAADPNERVIRFGGATGGDEEETDLALDPNGPPPLYAPPSIGVEYRYSFELEAPSLANWLQLLLDGHKVLGIQLRH